MSFELSMAVVMVISAALAVVHAFGTRPRGEALHLLITAVGFGYIFPFVDVNIFGHYGFDGEWTLLGLPFHLGFSWWAFYYLALCVAERVLGRGHEPIGLAVVAGVIFGLLEYQWDLTLLGAGLMELYVPSFAPYPYDFHLGVPMFHAMLGFLWIVGFHALRDSRKPALAIALGLAVLVGVPLFAMACLPLTEPLITTVSPHLSRYWQHTADVYHFASSFAPLGAGGAVILSVLGRKLGGAGSRDGRVGL